jgi:hypothetical protein
MAALGPTPFALILWGTLCVVALVFCYEVYVIGRDAGWV